MALSFGASDSPDASSTWGSIGTSLLGAGLGVASQFANGGLAPGATNTNINQATQTLPWMSQQWQNVFGAQNNAANRTSGQAIAGFTPAQLQAMQGIQNSVGFQMPALQQAQNTAGGLANGVGSSQISNFMNPFTQSAVNSTLATMNQQQNQQDANINSQANMAGAWGGDRSAVATNLNDQTWDQAKANTIANLNNQGYQSAVNSALQNQGLQLQGNQQFTNNILSNIGANTAQYQNLLGVGNQQQAQNQNVANWPIEQAQIMSQNLNPGVGSSTIGTNKAGVMQNPITGALTGLAGGLQLGNGLYSALGGTGSVLGGLGSLLGNGNGIDPSLMTQMNNDAANQLSGLDYSMPEDYNTDPSMDDLGDSGALGNFLGSNGISFNSAGGEAANQVGALQQYQNPTAVAGWSSNSPTSSGGMSWGGALGGLSSVAGIGLGLQRGGFSGDAQAALNAAKLGGQAGLYGSSASTVNSALGGLGGLMGLYNGIKQGGAIGDVNAAMGAAQVVGAAANAGLLGSGALGAAGAGIGAAAGAAAFPLAGFMAINMLGNAAPYNQSDAMGSAAQFVGTANQEVQNALAEGYGPGTQQYQYAEGDAQMAALQQQAVDSPYWADQTTQPFIGVNGKPIQIGGIGTMGTRRYSES